LFLKLETLHLQFFPMATAVRSFAKINIGLAIGPLRDDNFHNLRTVYQTIGLHDVLKVDVARGTGIEIRCKDQRVPADESNTCYRVAERMLRTLGQRGKVTITIEKRLPVQGGLGAASSNAVATLLGMQRELKLDLPAEEQLRICEEVGSDLPLFLVGGTVLGIGRGEQVFPLEDLPEFHCVVVTPQIAISTPRAFADWDALSNGASSHAYSPSRAADKLTNLPESDKLISFSRTVYAWLSSGYRTSSGVPPVNGDRAEAPLLDLVRTGIENDFERVVFPQHPELRDIKRVLYGQAGDSARYASLSGSGSTMYGFFDAKDVADEAATRISALGHPAHVTRTLTRKEYWNQLFV
jgi:4-diphosphocytidyl-2-C-methyl-D-erythritol kinase